MSSVDRELATVQAAMGALATSPHLARADFESFHAQAKQVVQELQDLQELLSTNIVLSDPLGQQLVNTRTTFGNPLPVHGNPSLISRVAATAQPAVSDLFTGNVSGSMVVNVGVPVRREGKVVFVLTAAISPASLAQVIKRHNFPQGWIVAILDSTGTVVTRTHQADRFIGKKATPLLQVLETKRGGTIESTTLEGIPVFTTFTRSDTTNWTAVLGVPREELMRELWLSVWRALGITTLLLVSGFAVAWYIGRRISVSVKELSKPTMALGYGEVATVPPLYFREADDLGLALTTASEMLRESTAAVAVWQARMRGILESAMDAIVVVDDDQHVILFNSAAVALFGWPPEEALGRPLNQFIPERLRAKHADHVEAFAASGARNLRTGHGGPIFGLKRNGDEFPMEASVSQISEGGKRIFTVILRDVSDRLKAQRALERSNVDLQQYAYVASHDLKGPLRSINGFVQLLERLYAPKLDARGVDLIRRTSKAASRLEQLTNDLLQLAQVDSEGPAFALVSCQEVVEEVLQLMQEPIEKAQANISVESLPEVLASRIQLVHVILNLISNALKYRSTEPVRVRIWSERSSGFWKIFVADNGIGIDPENFKQIFDVFNRLHDSDEYEGTGIGLALCRKIVERHGGTIWVESALGAGSTFMMTLPALAPPSGQTSEAL